MAIRIENALKLLWIVCLIGATTLTFIYIILGEGFDSLYFQFLAVLLLGYLPYTLTYRFFSAKLQKYLLFINMCIITLAVSILLPLSHSNQVIVIFLPLLAVLFNSRILFFIAGVFSLFIYVFMGLISGFYPTSYLEMFIEVSLLVVYLLLLRNVLKLLVRQSKNNFLFEKTVNTLIMAVEAKDDYTQGHSVRVCEYSMMIGKYMKNKGYNVDLESLKISSILHDIGKIKIPIEILKKDGKLTTEEFNIVKKHPKDGADLAQELEYPKEIVDSILYHHERFDGKGYPSGLMGEEIPINGKIIALADTFDALTSSRPYRNAFTADKAYEIIVENMSTQFDPEFEEIFNEVFLEFVKYHTAKQDHHKMQDMKLRSIK